jgi:hypothetical protein
MRTSLRVAAIAAVATLLMASSVLAKGHQSRHSLAGTWIISVTYYDFGILTYMQGFTHDGRTTLILPSGAPDVGDGWDETRSGCVGEWQRAKGPHEFDITMYCLWSAQNYGATPDRIRIKATLDGDGQFWEGPFDYEVYDEATGEWIGDDGYHMTGTRVGVVPYEP